MVVSTNEIRHHDSLLWQESGLYECTSEFINMTHRCFESCYGNQMECFPWRVFVLSVNVLYLTRLDSIQHTTTVIESIVIHVRNVGSYCICGYSWQDDFSGYITTETCLVWIYQINCVRCGLNSCVVWHFLVLWDSNAVLFRKNVLKMWSLNSIISWWCQPVR